MLYLVIFFNNPDVYTMSAIYYLFSAGPLVVLFVIYYMLIREMNVVMNKESAKRLCYQIIGYPIVLSLNQIFNVVSMVIEDTEGCQTEVSLLLNLGWAFQGLVDAVMYGFNPIFKEELRNRGKGRVREGLTVSEGAGTSLVE